MSIQQIDWCLAKYAQENPERLKVFAPDGTELGKPGGAQWASIKAAWDRVLSGEALRQHQGLDKLSPITEAIRRMRAEGRTNPLFTKRMRPEVVEGPLAKARDPTQPP